MYVLYVENVINFICKNLKINEYNMIPVYIETLF